MIATVALAPLLQIRVAMSTLMLAGPGFGMAEDTSMTMPLGRGAWGGLAPVPAPLPEVPLPIPPPPTVGDYQLLGQLARGGMSGVYLARHQHTGARVAIKLLADHWRSHAGVVQRLLDEHQLARRIDAAVAAGLTLDAATVLAKVPHGLDPAHPRALLLRHKGCVVGFPAIPRGAIHTPALATWLVAQARLAAPMVAWLQAHVA